MSQFPSDAPSPPDPSPIADAAAPLPYLPAIPPTIPGELPRVRPVWPVVIGIIAITFGVAGTLMSLWGIATPFFTQLFEGLVPAGQPDPFASMRKWQWSLVGVNAVGTLVAVVLLVGGIGLVRRRVWSVQAIVAWSIAKLLLTIALVVVTAGMQIDQFEDIAANSTRGTPMPAGFGIGIAIFTGLFSLLWYSALPVFMLVWFTRRGVKAHVASGFAAPHPAPAQF